MQILSELRKCPFAAAAASTALGRQMIPGYLAQQTRERSSGKFPRIRQPGLDLNILNEQLLTHKEGTAERQVSWPRASICCD